MTLFFYIRTLSVSDWSFLIVLLFEHATLKKMEDSQGGVATNTLASMEHVRWAKNLCYSLFFLLLLLIQCFNGCHHCYNRKDAESCSDFAKETGEMNSRSSEAQCINEQSPSVTMHFAGAVSPFPFQSLNYGRSITPLLMTYLILIYCTYCL